jgi:cytochrome c553
MHKITLPLALAIAVIGTGCSSLDRSRDLGDPRVSGETLAQQVCSICHGLDGSSISPKFPRLGGQQKQYIENQLRNFRSKQRADPPGPEYMWGIARSLTDEQIAQLADYFSKQTPKPNTPAPPAIAAEGKKLFENGLPDKDTPPCEACHGPDAQGRGSFPRLAGQHKYYLLRQLHIFQETELRPGTPMKQITHALTPQQMEILATYLQGLGSGSASD